MRLALYQPDIPQNAGAIIRLGACLGVPIDIIEPCGFFLDDRRLRRAGMDYVGLATVVRHRSWAVFHAAAARDRARLLLLTTTGDRTHTEVAYDANDILVCGRESAGVPDEVHQAVGLRMRIPMVPGARSFNVANAAAMVLAEALRQTNGFPETPA